MFDPRELTFLQRIYPDQSFSREQIRAHGRVVDLYMSVNCDLVVRKEIFINGKTSWTQCKRELDVMVQVQHIEGVAELLHSSATESSIVLYMPYYEHGDLHSLASQYQYSAVQVGRFIYPIACTIYHMHQCGFAHRDIKLENIYLQAPGKPGFAYKTFVGDYGLSVFSTGLQRTGVGTLSYVAPEILMRTADEYYDPFKSDVWSLGICLFGLITGRSFFAACDDINSHIAEVKRYETCQNVELPEVFKEFSELITGMLAFDPDKRLSIGDVVRDPYLRRLLPYDLLGEDDLKGILIRSASASVVDDAISNENESARTSSEFPDIALGSKSENSTPRKSEKRPTPRKFADKVYNFFSSKK